MRAAKGEPLNGYNLHLMFSVFFKMGKPDVRQPTVKVHVYTQLTVGKQDVELCSAMDIICIGVATG